MAVCVELPNCRYVIKLFSKYINLKINTFKKIFEKKNFLKEDNYFSDDSRKATAKQAKKTSSTTSTTMKITKTTRSTQKMTHVTSSTTTTLSPQQIEENNQR